MRVSLRTKIGRNRVQLVSSIGEINLATSACALGIKCPYTSSVIDLSHFLGAVVGLVTAAFLLIEPWLVDLVWETIPHQIGEFGLYTLIVCSLDGLLAGTR